MLMVFAGHGVILYPGDRFYQKKAALKMPRGKLKKNFPSFFRPVCCFPLWVLSLALLTYGPESLQLKLWIFLAGLMVPAWLYFRTTSTEKKPHLSASLLTVPPWLLIFLAGLALFLRFFKLTSLTFWPNGDEGISGTVFVHLNSHWDWKFFHLFGQAPASLYWLGALILRLTHSPFLSLWLGPALVSVLWLPAIYLFLSAFWDKTTAWIGTGLTAFSYWPLMLGRVFCPGDLLPLWECLLLALLGRLLKAPPARRSQGAALLGVTAGLGFITFTPWIAVAAWVSLFGLPGFSLKPKPIAGGIWPSISRAFSSLFLPGAALALQENFGRHIFNLWAHSQGAGLFQLLWTTLHYLAFIFTGLALPDTSYIPLEGGFLNPLLGAFFIAGVLGLSKSRQWVSFAWLAGLGITFLPGMLSGGLETFRAIGMLPLLLAVTALGVRHFLTLLPAPSRIGVLTAVLLLTASFDFSRLSAPDQNFTRDPASLGQAGLSYENWKAYQILKVLNERMGPGLALTDFSPGIRNETLGFASYPFNKAWNDAIPENQLHWAALCVSSSYQPFLRARFPQMRWIPLGPGSHPAWVLGVLPWNDPDSRTFLAWNQAHRFFMELNDEILEVPNGVSREEILDQMLKAGPGLSADPFIQSCYWEKIISMESWESAFYPPPPSTQNELYALAFNQWGLKGYQTSLFWLKKSLWLFSLNQKQEAQKCLLKARSLDPSLADPAETF